MLGPTLVGSTVTLGPLRADDLQLYAGWFSDPAVTHYLMRDSPPSLKQEEEWFDGVARSEKDVVWALYVDGQPVGSTGIHNIEWRSRHAITGTLIAERALWGKGIGGESMRLRSRYAFDELGLEKLTTYVFEGNAASRRGLERAGYETVGVLRRHEFRHGQWWDVWIGELLRDRWLGLQTA
ncbi:MAG: GNAT family protein [Chloroflexota bacterium]